MKKFVYILSLMLFFSSFAKLYAQYSMNQLKQFFTNKNFVVKQTTGSVFTTLTYKNIFLCEIGCFYLKSSSTFDFGIDQSSSKEALMGSWDIVDRSGYIYLMLSKIGTDGYYDLLHITFNDKNEVLLNGDTVNFNAINSCYNRYTVADVKYFFDNKHLAVSFKDKSNSENGLTMVINVCESGICEIKELPYEGYFIKNEKNYQATWDIKIIQGKTFFYWQEKNSNKINRAELNYMLNEALFWNYEPLDVSIIEDANTCNNIYQRYQRN